MSFFEGFFQAFYIIRFSVIKPGKGADGKFCVFVGCNLLRVTFGRTSHTPDKPEIRDPIVLVAFDKHNIAPLHTYNPIYNYIILS